MGRQSFLPPYIFNFKEEQNAYIFSTVMLASFSVASKTRGRVNGDILGNIGNHGRNV